MTAALEGGEWSAACPSRTLPLGKTRYPFYRKLGGPQDRSGWAENLVPTGIRSRTVQPIVSRYTDWAPQSTSFDMYHLKMTELMLHFSDQYQFYVHDWHIGAVSFSWGNCRHVCQCTINSKVWLKGFQCTVRYREAGRLPSAVLSSKIEVSI